MSKANHLQLVEEQLHQRFNEISSEIKSISLEGNEESLRKLVDERRQILDGLEAYGFDPSSEDGINALANRFVESWTKRILLIGDPDELPKYLSDPHICHSYIDYLAPLTWNWEKDWLVLVRPAHEMLVATLVDRGQKHILVFAIFPILHQDLYYLKKFLFTSKYLIKESATNTDGHSNSWRHGVVKHRDD